MTIAVFPGSFDPITLGHLDIAIRAAKIFDEVIIAIAANASKQPLLPLETRVEVAADAVTQYSNIRVATVPGLLVDFCKTEGATCIVKGLRGGADYDAELPMALMNKELSGIETIFIPGSSQLAHIASSLVKDIHRHNGEIASFVPAAVLAALTKKAN